MMARRPFALLLLLCQMLLAGAAPVADARLEAGAISAGSELHVEDADSGPCAPAHDHDTCVICRALHVLDFGPVGDTRLAGLLRIHSPSSLRSIPAPRVAVLVAAHGPRAPPV